MPLPAPSHSSKSTLTKKLIHSISLLLLLIVGCQSRQPYVGVIVVDTDLPTLYNGKLPIGVTLDPGHNGRDLLSDNMLINGGFELARRPEGTGYNFATKEVVTPNGNHLFYPLPEQCHGWQILGGDIHVIGGDQSHHLLIQANSSDSLVAIKQPLEGVDLRQGERYHLSLVAKAYGSATIHATLVGDSLNLLSQPLSLSPNGQDSLLYGSIVATKDSPNTSLLLQIKVAESTPYQIQSDSVTYWTTRGKATITIDNIKLSTTPPNGSINNLQRELYPLLDSLAPSFVRFPSGATANGLYPGTYPVHLDSSAVMPLWTLRQNEYTGDFTYHSLLLLAKRLHSTPILVTNFGFTDPSTIQRVEDIKLLPQRIEEIQRLIEVDPDKEVAIQPGYNLSSAEYERRFAQLVNKLDTIYPNLQLISAGNRMPYLRYSDYPYDLSLPPITYDRLEEIDSLLSTHDQLFYPQLVSEATFDSDYDNGYFLPPLALRAAFMILAEQRTPYIKVLGITPLISTNLAQDFPIILAKNGGFTPTLLYYYLRDFKEQRGEDLCRMAQPNNLKSDIITSLTSDRDKEVYYLKAVNVTRHPLHYQIKLKGQKSDFSSVQITSYTSTAPTTSQSPKGFSIYQRHTSKERLPLQKQMNYLFAPYEVVIFKFQ